MSCTPISSRLPQFSLLEKIALFATITCLVGGIIAATQLPVGSGQFYLSVGIAAVSPLLLIGLVIYHKRPKVEVSSDKMINIRFIITTLAESNTATIAWQMSALNQAGKQIKDVPPLELIKIILQDPDLKAKVLQIRDKPLVWSQFQQNIQTALAAEYAANRLNMQMIKIFCSNLSLDFSKVNKTIASQKWAEFIELCVS